MAQLLPDNKWTCSSVNSCRWRIPLPSTWPSLPWRGWESQGWKAAHWVYPQTSLTHAPRHSSVDCRLTTESTITLNAVRCQLIGAGGRRWSLGNGHNNHFTCCNRLLPLQRIQDRNKNDLGEECLNLIHVQYYLLLEYQIWTKLVFMV